MNLLAQIATEAVTSVLAKARVDTSLPLSRYAPTDSDIQLQDRIMRVRHALEAAQLVLRDVPTPSASVARAAIADALAGWDA